jgi:beta-hydroxylase
VTADIAVPVFQDYSPHPFLLPLQDHWEAIRDEYLAIAHQGQPWHERALHNGRWETVGLYQFGKWLPQARACPVTTRCLRDVPGLFLAGFSVLKAGCRIHPHRGYTTEVLRSHLGLVCPQPSWIEVAGERYHWAPGQGVVFDDTQVHSAANESGEPRVVLIVDFFR